MEYRHVQEEDFVVPILIGIVFGWCLGVAMTVLLISQV